MFPALSSRQSHFSFIPPVYFLLFPSVFIPFFYVSLASPFLESSLPFSFPSPLSPTSDSVESVPPRTAFHLYIHTSNHTLYPQWKSFLHPSISLMNATRENMPRKMLALGHNCPYYVLSPPLLPLLPTPLFFTQRLNGKSNDCWRRVGGEGDLHAFLRSSRLF